MGVTKAISDRLGKGGIADRMIWFNGFPFLDNKEDHTFNVPVSTVSTPSVSLKCLPITGLAIADVEAILAESSYSGFPIVEDATSMTLIGYIGRTELRYALDRARRERHAPLHAKCSFNPATSRNPSMTPATPGPAVSFDDMASNSGQMMVDLARFVDATPISVHPRLPLETVMELFKKMGPRVILVEHRGRLMGLVTVKDCLKYQFQAEAQENPRDDRGVREGQERIWGLMRRSAEWAGSRLGLSRLGRLGHVRLSSSEGLFSAAPSDRPLSGQGETERRTHGSISSGMELQDR